MNWLQRMAWEEAYKLLSRGQKQQEAGGDPRSGKEFTAIVIERVRERTAARWTDDHIKEWIRSVIGAKFGADGWGWTRADAVSLGDEFLAEASTW